MRYFPAYEKVRYSLVVRQDLQIGNYMYVSRHGVVDIIMLWPCVGHRRVHNRSKNSQLQPFVEVAPS